MTLEALLAYAHLLAILTLVVFIASEAALCRPEWMNATIVDRLVTVDRVYGIAAVAVLRHGAAAHLVGHQGHAAGTGATGCCTSSSALFVAGRRCISIMPTIRVHPLAARQLRGRRRPARAAEVRSARKLVDGAGAPHLR